MPVQITPGMKITSDLRVVKTRNNSIGVINEKDMCFTGTSLSFVGTRVTDVIREYYELNGKDFSLNTEPIIRIKKVPQSQSHRTNYSGMVIAAKIDYDEGNLTYGWSVAVASDGFDQEFGKNKAIDRLHNSPLVVKYDPSKGIIDNVCFSSGSIATFKIIEVVYFSKL